MRILTQVLLATLAIGSMFLSDVDAAENTHMSRPAQSKLMWHIREGHGTLAPFSYVQFCVANPRECLSEIPKKAIWSPYTKAIVSTTNTTINQTVRPVNDAGDEWSLPTKSGDCEDFALYKRSVLIKQGIPSSALRMAVALTPSGEGHAVLVLTTRSGDFVLDNRTNAILRWDRTDLHWLRIASQDDPYIWHAAY